MFVLCFLSVKFKSNRSTMGHSKAWCMCFTLAIQEPVTFLFLCFVPFFLLPLQSEVDGSWLVLFVLISSESFRNKKKTANPRTTNYKTKSKNKERIELQDSLIFLWNPPSLFFWFPFFLRQSRSWKRSVVALVVLSEMF